MNRKHRRPLTIAFPWILCALGLLALGRLRAAGPAGEVPEFPIPSYFRGEPLHIGNQVQLLIDDYIVEDRWKMTRETGEVTKHLRNPIVIADKPWEGQIGTYPCVLRDPATGKYRMYFDNFHLTNYFNPVKGAPSYYVGYAESDDAINWTKPMMEGFPYGEFPRTNIVSMGADGKRAGAAQVMLNPDQSDPQRRFLIVYQGTRQTHLAYSADGLHWNTREEPLLRYKSDFPNHLVYVPEHKLWYLYVRPSIRPNGRGPLPEGMRHTGRRLSMTTSSDLLHWSDPRTVMYPDERDEPDYDNIMVFRRYGMFLALYAQMAQEHGESESQVFLASSRDGINWERTWDRKPLIPHGAPGSYDHGQIEIGTSPPLEIGENMFFYYWASPKGQISWDQDSAVAVARLRKDRFVGQRAGNETGYLLTRQFVLEGSKLLLNTSVLPFAYFKHGIDGLRVAIIQAPDYQTPQTMFETPVPGFALEDCDPFETDNTAYAVTWKGSSDLSSLKGKKVYLRFQLKNAVLYSFQIAP
ncbi:MAG: hypothetical protein JWM32_2414 [Verrucomicrobia bacterium]|nr:hypothetical protein [Verrucomicrobiota bacterium]